MNLRHQIWRDSCVFLASLKINYWGIWEHEIIMVLIERFALIKAGAHFGGAFMEGLPSYYYCQIAAYGR